MKLDDFENALREEDSNIGDWLIVMACVTAMILGGIYVYFGG